MHNQKSDQEQTCKTHDVFFTERGSEEPFPCHKPRRLIFFRLRKSTTGTVKLNI